MHKIPHFSYKLNKKNFYNNSYIHIIPSFGYTSVNRNKIDFNNNIKRYQFNFHFDIYRLKY